MNKNTILATLATLTLLIMLVLFVKSQKADELKIANFNYKTLNSQAIELNILKQKYSSKSNSRVLNELKRMRGFQRESKKQNRLKLEYAQLNPADLDNLSNKILNSSLQIYSLFIKKDDDFNSSLELEVSIWKSF